MAIKNRDEFLSGKSYHFYNRSGDRGSIFLSDDDFIYFLDRYKHYFSPLFDTYAFCLMKNHFHFIIKIRPEDDIKLHAAHQNGIKPDKYVNDLISLDEYLTDQLKRFFSSVGVKFNNRQKKHGQVFARYPKRVIMDNEDRLRFMIAYVHHNPIHHGFSNSYDSWKYSSYKAILSDNPTSLIREDVLKLFEDFGGLKKFHKTYREMKRIEGASDADSDL